jgi:hypothetical protein
MAASRNDITSKRRPGFYEAHEAAFAGTDGGTLLVGLHPAATYPGVSYRPCLETGAWSTRTTSRTADGGWRPVSIFEAMTVDGNTRASYPP